MCTHSTNIASSKNNMGLQLQRTTPLCDNPTAKISTLRGLCSSQEHRSTHEQTNTTVSGCGDDCSREKTSRTRGGRAAALGNNLFHSGVLVICWGNAPCKMQNKATFQGSSKCVSLKPAWYMDMAVWKWLHGRGCLAMWMWTLLHGSCGTSAFGKWSREPVGARLALVAFEFSYITAAAITGLPAFKGKERRPCLSLRKMPSSRCNN